jgi:hypothetical protein
LHKYLYTHADPTNGIDPSGEFGLGGIGISMSISSNMRGINVGVATSALKSAVWNIAKYVTQKTVQMIMPTLVSRGYASWGGYAIANASLAYHRACMGILVRGITDYVIRGNLLPVQKELYDFSYSAFGLNGHLGAVKNEISGIMGLGALSLDEILHPTLAEAIGWPMVKAQFGIVLGSSWLGYDALKLYSSGITSMYKSIMDGLRHTYNNSPDNFRRILEPKLKLQRREDINDLYVVPHFTNIVTAGLTFSLNPEREVRLLRIIVEQIDKGNYQLAGNDALSLVDSLVSKYGSIVVNNRTV